MKITPNDLDGMRPADHDRRIAVMRRLAGWELGSAGWADRLLSAYEHPTETTEYLDREEGA